MVERPSVIKVDNALTTNRNRERFGQLGVIALGDVFRLVGEGVEDLEGVEFGLTSVDQGNLEMVASGLTCGVEIVLDENGFNF